MGRVVRVVALALLVAGAVGCGATAPSGDGLVAPAATRVPRPPEDVVRGRLAAAGLATGDERNRCIAVAAAADPALASLVDGGAPVTPDQVPGWFAVLAGCGVGDEELVDPVVQAVRFPTALTPADLACLRAAAAGHPRVDLVTVVGTPGTPAADALLDALVAACTGPAGPTTQPSVP